LLHRQVSASVKFYVCILGIVQWRIKYQAPNKDSLIFSVFKKAFSTTLTGIATGYGLDNRTIGVRIPVRVWNFSLRRHVQTGSGGAHPASYPVGT